MIYYHNYRDECIIYVYVYGNFTGLNESFRNPGMYNL